eukprot:CAMPEP_0169151638 /NCGR_PEP_ID=MMETSP1015-20121227/50972_1 /TAXON_ID=342587 /ORGANISM="Karlodinium micrum, Strain CCMP2283" /LENGTH=164 /DNA_ID=CAMNT_0009221149 /DNA_START=102 /DNA_END=596 /DNA_ORIENTATION=+
MEAKMDEWRARREAKKANRKKQIDRIRKINSSDSNIDVSAVSEYVDISRFHSAPSSFALNFLTNESSTNAGAHYASKDSFYCLRSISMLSVLREKEPSHRVNQQSHGHQEVWSSLEQDYEYFRRFWMADELEEPVKSAQSENSATYTMTVVSSPSHSSLHIVEG